MPSIDRLDAASSGRPKGNTYPVLSSDWTGLSSHLIAKFYPVRRIVEGTNIRWEREPGSTEVRAPITEGQIEQTSNWTSPFENQTADARLSSLSAMFQVGGFEAIANSIQSIFGADSTVGEAVGGANAQLKTLEGKTAVTKLNSTQVFTGMPPLKLTMTVHFMALYDADSEVRKPMMQLVQWAAPKKLATQGLVGNLVDPNSEKGIRTIYPSDAPQILGFEYADMLIKPVVVELSPYPLTMPRDKDGKPISGQMTLSIGTLTAMDRDDWAAMLRP